MSVLIVAELSASHNGSLANALALVREAKKAGADAVKLQSFLPETIAADGAPEYCLLKEGPWKGKTLRQLYQEAYTPRDWHHELFKEARRIGLQVFSTPFCPADVDFLETLDCARYKVSSFDIVNAPLIDRLIHTGKPIIMSTGMAAHEEIEEALQFIPPTIPLTLMHCVSQYPATEARMSLIDMRDYSALYDADVGLSDHSMTPLAAILSVALGAKIIEKHLCLSRDLGGPDSGFSLEPHEFRDTVSVIRAAQLAMEHREPDQTNRHFRPSLWLVRPISAGQHLTAEHVAVMRPNAGLPPNHLESLIGKVAASNYRPQQPIKEGMFRG